MLLRNQIRKILREYSINENIEELGLSDKIIERITPGLPLRKFTNTSEESGDDNISPKTRATLVLQRVLNDLGFKLGTSGINNDGVDGDFGSKTESAVRDAVNSNELNNTNINKFGNYLKEKESILLGTVGNTNQSNKDIKIEEYIGGLDRFIEQYVEQKGVKKETLNLCKEKTKYPDIEFVKPTKECHTREVMADYINKALPEESKILKASILSVMMKEQNKGQGNICGKNNNFAGIQTDISGWGDLTNVINGQFCAEDKERVRIFASFENPEDCIRFIRDEFENTKNWSETISGDNENIDLGNIAKKHAQKWQSDWNLSLSDEEFQNYVNNGYNYKFAGSNNAPSFTDERGIYTKSVDELTKDELDLHNKYKYSEPDQNGNKKIYYREPSKIQNSLSDVENLFIKSYNYFN